jgi:hypothetical protein
VPSIFFLKQNTCPPFTSRGPDSRASLLASTQMRPFYASPAGRAKGPGRRRETKQGKESEWRLHSSLSGSSGGQSARPLLAWLRHQLLPLATRRHITGSIYRWPRSYESTGCAQVLDLKTSCLETVGTAWPSRERKTINMILFQNELCR